LGSKDGKTNLFALVIMVFSLIILISSAVYNLSSKVSKEEMKQIEKNAQRLVEANFDAASYFGISTLTAESSYNPQDYPDGAIPCASNIFSSYDELSKFIENTYIPSYAAILMNSESNGQKRYFEYNGKLCMAKVDPKTNYDKDWSTYKISLSNVQKKSADITVAVKLKTSGEDAQIKLKMVKQGDKWLLTNLAY